MGALQTAPPGGGAHEVPDAAECYNDQKGPAQATDAVEHIADTRALDEIDKERQPADGGKSAAEGEPPAATSHGGGGHLGGRRARSR